MNGDNPGLGSASVSGEQSEEQHTEMVHRTGMFENLLEDIPLEIAVELGRVTMTLREIANRLGEGSVIALSKLTGEKLDLRINDQLVARGEAVAVGERYGIRIVEIVTARGAKET